jgi:hypothetical protein
MDATDAVLSNPDLIRLVLLLAPASVKATAAAVCTTWRAEAAPLIDAHLGATWDSAYLAMFWSRRKAVLEYAWF